MAKKKSKSKAKATVSSLANKSLDKAIEGLDELEEITPQDFAKVIRENTPEAFAARQLRRTVRYRLKRIQTEFLGGPASHDKDNIKELFEGKPGFNGWKNYGISWDVSFDDPYRVVTREFSREDEWDQVVRSKFPSIEPGSGKIVYPDTAVEAAVKREAVRQKELEQEKD